MLIAEDNPRMAELIRQGFVQLGYAVDVAGLARQADELAVSQPYDVIILDIMFPDKDGVQLCRDLRRQGVTAPILMLTALSTTKDKVTAFDAGADDYLTKPFEFDELHARVRALMRRGHPQEGATIRIDDIEMDLLSHKVMRGGERIKLSNKEFALLEYFMRNPGRVLGRANIAEHVWDMTFSGESNVIDVYVGLLRRKIDHDAGKKLIHTVIGRGYYFGPEPPDS
jgi:two-component system, OmpR family, copper resistance phosphate regulon response regulator CusR